MGGYTWILVVVVAHMESAMQQNSHEQDIPYRCTVVCRP